MPTSVTAASAAVSFWVCDDTGAAAAEAAAAATAVSQVHSVLVVVVAMVVIVVRGLVWQMTTCMHTF